jgi:hypothetical protein
VPSKWSILAAIASFLGGVATQYGGEVYRHFYPSDQTASASVVGTLARSPLYRFAGPASQCRDELVDGPGFVGTVKYKVSGYRGWKIYAAPVATNLTTQRIASSTAECHFHDTINADHSSGGVLRTWISQPHASGRYRIDFTLWGTKGSQTRSLAQAARTLTFTLGSSTGQPIKTFVEAEGVFAQGFKLPSGNIVCRTAGFGISCAIASGLNPGPSASDCASENAHDEGLQLSSEGSGAVACGDELASLAAAGVLQYGQVWYNPAEYCLALEIGLECTSTSGHGFFLSREHWATF